MIHGIRNGLGWLGSTQSMIDWTNGCIAVTDAEMDELWDLIPDGTPVHLNPNHTANRWLRLVSRVHSIGRCNTS